MVIVNSIGSKRRGLANRYFFLGFFLVASFLLATFSSYTSASTINISRTGVLPYYTYDFNYVASSGEENNLEITYDSSLDQYEFSDSGASTISVPSFAGRCTVTGSTASCKMNGKLTVDLGDEGDSVSLDELDRTQRTVINGGDGDDNLIGSLSADDFNGGDGKDTVSYHARTADITMTPETYAADDDGEATEADNIADDIEVYKGTANSEDTITTADGVDAKEFYVYNGGSSITTFGNSDVIESGEGVDIIDAGNGTNTIDSGRSDDQVVAGSGNDKVTPGDDADYIDVGAGYDYIDLIIDSEADTVIGGDDKDEISYFGESTELAINLSAGTVTQYRTGTEVVEDTFTGIENATGSEVDDTIIGDSGSNYLEGYAGDDTLIGNGGSDELSGGDGTDTVSYAWSNSGVIVHLEPGFYGGDAEYDDGTSRLDIVKDVENATGSNSNDTLVGYGIGMDSAREPISGNNVLSGGEGDDILINLEGEPSDDTTLTDADTFIGGGGADTVDYSEYADDLRITLDDTANDGLAEAGSSGDDNVNSDIENITSGSGDDLIVGNDNDNVITAGSGTDFIYGKGGSDTLYSDSDETASDASVDTVSCGNGTDVSYAESIDDVASDCESSYIDTILQGGATSEIGSVTQTTTTGEGTSSNGGNTTSSCTATKTKIKYVSLGKKAKFYLTGPSGGYIDQSKKSSVKFKIVLKGKRAKKLVQQVTFKLDGKKVTTDKKAPFVYTLRASKLATLKAGNHVLYSVVKTKNGAKKTKQSFKVVANC